MELMIRDELYTTSESPTYRNMINEFETISFKYVPLADSVIKEIDYDEVLELFLKLETCIFIIGEKGETCTENVMDFVNKLAKKHNISNVYLLVG